MTVLWILLAACLISAAVFVVACIRAPYVDAQYGGALTFDEHAAVACALLQPDEPTLPRPLSFVEQVEAYVAQHAPKES